MKTKVEIHYGEELLPISVDDDVLVYELKPAEIEPVTDLREEVRRALSEPIGTDRLSLTAEKGMKVVIIGDDETRFTPTQEIIPVLLDELNKGGVPDEDVSVVIATGTHRPMTGEEIQKKYGSEVMDRIRVVNHDCLDTDNLLSCGVTRRGTDIWVNRLVLEADLRIGVGNIVPHHPTGWSGGAKILLPGVAGQKTTAQMHLLGATEQQLGKVETPCREEMEDFASEVGLEFLVNSVLDRHGRAVAIVAGHYIAAHRRGVEWAKKVFGVSFPGKTDVTVSSTYPVDFDLFQADKGLFSAALSTKPGGEIILLSLCREGVSPTHEESVELAGYSDEELYRIARSGEHDPLSAAEVLYFNSIKRDFRITIASEGVGPETAARLGFQHADPRKLGDYIQRKIAENGGRTLGFVHYSAETLPLERV